MYVYTLYGPISTRVRYRYNTERQQAYCILYLNSGSNACLLWSSVCLCIVCMLCGSIELVYECVYVVLLTRAPVFILIYSAICRFHGHVMAHTKLSWRSFCREKSFQFFLRDIFWVNVLSTGWRVRG